MHISERAEDWLTLTSLAGFGSTTVLRLIEILGSPRAVLAAGKSIQDIEGVGPKVVQTLCSSGMLDKGRHYAAKVLDQIQKQNVSLLCYDDAAYPAQLKEIADAPPMLYCRGDYTVLGQPSLGIVGSRAATAYGKRISFTLAAGLAEQGLLIASGGASGIDGEAHKGAMSFQDNAGRQGKTILVLGCGPDVVYPRQHVQLFAQVREQGCLVSEYPPGTAPDGFRFPARNRLISGLSLGVVVVEATEKSGSLITARLAADQGREVFAVPGRVDAFQSIGCHRLIQQGAYLCHEVEDILAILGWEDQCARVQKQAELEQVLPSLAAEEKQIVEALDAYPLDVDSLGRNLQINSALLHGYLLHLELKGLVRQLPGQVYERAW